jgi:hypothetical protein
LSPGSLMSPSRRRAFLTVAITHRILPESEVLTWIHLPACRGGRRESAGGAAWSSPFMGRWRAAPEGPTWISLPWPKVQPLP